MNFGKLITIGVLLYVLFFNDRTVEMSINKSNKQIASIGLDPNPNAIGNRKAVCAFTGFFLDPSQESVSINVEKGFVAHGDTLFRFDVVKTGANYILVDYGIGYERDFFKLEPNTDIAIISENDLNNITILKRIDKRIDNE